MKINNSFEVKKKSSPFIKKYKVPLLRSWIFFDGIIYKGAAPVELRIKLKSLFYKDFAPTELGYNFSPSGMNLVSMSGGSVVYRF